MFKRTPRTLMAPVAGAALLAIATPALADRGDPWERIRDHAAYVEEPGLLDFADDQTEIIEVTLRGPLLRAGARILEREEPEIAQLVLGLEAVNAVVLNDWDGSPREARRRMRDIAEDLGRHWERLVRIRKSDEFVLVYVHLDRYDEIDGLLVMMHENDTLVFTNLIGDIDLEHVAELTAHMDIPGLERVPETRDPVDIAEDGGEDT